MQQEHTAPISMRQAVDRHLGQYCHLEIKHCVQEHIRKKDILLHAGLSSGTTLQVSLTKAKTTDIDEEPAVPFWKRRKPSKATRKWSVRLQNKPENSGRNQYERMYKKQKFVKVRLAQLLFSKIATLLEVGKLIAP